MADSSKVRLTIPRQDLTAPGAFRPNSQAAQEWLQTLPVTRVLDCARQLADALAELNRTRLAPEQRFAILEVLYPSLDGAVTSLSKRFLNQPLVMPEGPRTMAELTASLLGFAAMGYTIVAVETIQRQDAIREMNPARLACESIQRALLCYGRRVLQHFQLYHPLAIQEWQALHQLYALAERQQLEALPVPEPLSGGATIHATYLQSLLLSCSKPNQLRQADMAALFHALAEWAERVAIALPGGEGGLFVVDLNSDQPPLYSSLLADRITDSCRYLQTAALVAHLTEMRDAQDTQRQTGAIRSTLQLHLLDHLVAALGSMSLRNFKRTPSDAPLRVCLGLSSTHYHVAGKRDFERLLEGSGYTRAALREKSAGAFLKPPDIWELANPGDNDLRDERAPQEASFIDDEYRVELDARTRARLLADDTPEPPQKERYPVYEVRLADASPGGYCLEWTEALPANLRTGDMVGLMEQHSRDWVIAVVRWLSSLESARTLIGLELLSPRARAFGAVIHQGPQGKSAPLRALLLPQIKLVGQPETLITARASFRERQRVTLVSGSDARTVQLCQLVAQTPGYLQFEFRVVRELGDVLANEGDGGHGKPFDSLWSNI